MHKTTIFIIQLCVVFKLFVVEVVKCHFRLNFVTPQWVQAIIDFHLMKLALRYGVACGQSQQSDYFDSDNSNNKEDTSELETNIREQTSFTE